MRHTIVDTKCPISVEDADTRSHKLLLSIVVCVIVLMMSPAMRGQATGSFSGNVADKSGSAIPGATVIATDVDETALGSTKAAGVQQIARLDVRDSTAVSAIAAKTGRIGDACQTPE